MGKKLLLDTDIGSDIDDVLALIYILNKMDAELLGITTVSGQAGQRANLAQKICFDENKKDIPIFRCLCKKIAPSIRNTLMVT